LSELSSRVDRSTSEGRARLLLEAKPLVKQITAPMLSLMLRKELAELTGITQQELDADFQIRSQAPAAPAARRALPAQRSIVMTAIELLVLEPRFAQGVDRAALAPGFGLPGLDQIELHALDRLLDCLGSSADPQALNVGEYFRETQYAETFERVEAGTLRWQERGLSADELQAEFTGAWRQLLDRVRRARMQALLEKSRQSPWSADEQSQMLLLQQQLVSGVVK
jgi:DNA primase